MSDERPHYKDPEIVRGPYRVLPRTCGDFVVFDTRQPPARGENGGGRTIDVATRRADMLVEKGSPQEYVPYPLPEKAPEKPKTRARKT